MSQRKIFDPKNRRERKAIEAFHRREDKRRSTKPMKTLKLDTQLTDTKGQPIRNGDNTGPADLRYVIVSALVSPMQGDGEAKFRRACLAVRIQDAGPEVQLIDQEIMEIRDIIGQNFSQPEVVRAAWIAIAESVAFVPTGKAPCSPPKAPPKLKVAPEVNSKSVQRRRAIQNMGGK